MKKLMLMGACLSLLAALGCGGGDKAADTTTAPAAGPAYPVDLANGKRVYDKACFACHMTGVNGAAIVTDKVRWQAQVDKGMPLLHKHVIEGVTGTFGTLPPRGTCVDCSDQDLYDAIHYMMSLAGVTPKY